MSGDARGQGRDPTALDGEGFEALLARCIEARDAGDLEALERLLPESAADAARVRARMVELERLGLLGGEESVPAQVAGHRILARLGRGGMGAVYLAEEDGGRRVALKLASLPPADGEPGRRARARFEREVRAIAQLDHPCIVAVRASGEHEGRPWFTMEHVRGATLSRVIERLRARGTPPEDLSATDARAALLAEVESDTASAPEPAPEDETVAEPGWSASYVEWCCRAVRDVALALEHAHAHGVVHRDVKPSNVLVRPDGRALLFDFGLAHVQDQASLTRTGDFAGTPYAVAPEQVESRRGPVEPRTDVWGLGVVLYELLALRRPFDGAGAAALLRRVLEEDPLPLRRLHPGLPHALEHVCATALEKAARRRYATARALADDLGRFLAGRRVLARGAAAHRRALRFVRRRPAAAAAVALALVVAVGLPTGLLAANAAVRAHARRAEHAAAEASRLARANAEVVGYLVDLFEPLGEDDTRADAGALAMLESQAQRLEVGLGQEPLARAALLEATGTVFENLGHPRRARPLYDRALAVRQSELGERHPATAALLGKLAHVSVETGDTLAALALCRRAEEALAASGEPNLALATRLRATSARALSSCGRLDEAAGELESALSMLRGDGVPDERAVAEVLEELAQVEAERGRPSEALARGEEALALRRASWLPEPRALARSLDQLAPLRASCGDEPGAEAARGDALALREALRATAEPAPLPPALVLADPAAPEYEASFQAGITALQARRLDEARERFERCLELRPASGVCMYNLACGHALAGHVEEALDWLERAAGRGFGLLDGRKEITLRDPDLAPVRDHPRFETLIERMAQAGEHMGAYVREPAVYVPPGLDEREAAKLLVVLHADGSSKDAIVDGIWGRVADELGCVLLAPCAPHPLGTTPQQGFAWFGSLADFEAQPLRQEAACTEALGAYLAARASPPQRVLVAGEGSGAMVAFDLALRAPGLVRGVLLVQGPALLNVPAARARTAAALGLRATGVLDPRTPLAWVDPGVSVAEYADAFGAWLETNGLGKAIAAAPDHPAEHRAALTWALRSLDG